MESRHKEWGFLIVISGNVNKLYFSWISVLFTNYSSVSLNHICMFFVYYKQKSNCKNLCEFT